MASRTAAPTGPAAVEAGAPPGLPRLFLIEDEYRVIMLRAELQWLRGVVDDLEAGRLTWDEEFIRATLADFGQRPSPEASCS